MPCHHAPSPSPPCPLPPSLPPIPPWPQPWSHPLPPTSSHLPVSVHAFPTHFKLCMVCWLQSIVYKSNKNMMCIWLTWTVFKEVIWQLCLCFNKNCNILFSLSRMLFEWSYACKLYVVSCVVVWICFCACVQQINPTLWSVHSWPKVDHIVSYSDNIIIAN